MTEPWQLVIFDCDGVLVDSERLAVRVEAAVLAELGWPLPEDEVIERRAVTDVTPAMGCAGQPRVLLYQYNDT
jgi:beta-phosphoglucomutase-like phosphatase (HAD superfamily)